jgi:hypothetical protein
MEKFARKCSATGNGMNEGYVVNDGEEYFYEESDLIKWLRGRDSDSIALSDEFLLKEAYDLEEYYWTQWDECDEDYWYNADGEEFNN